MGGGRGASRRIAAGSRRAALVVSLAAVSLVLSACSLSEERVMAAALVSARDLGPGWAPSGDDRPYFVPSREGCPGQMLVSPLLAFSPETRFDGEFRTVYSRIAPSCGEFAEVMSADSSTIEVLASEQVSALHERLRGGNLSFGQTLAYERPLREDTMSVEMFAEVNASLTEVLWLFGDQGFSTGELVAGGSMIYYAVVLRQTNGVHELEVVVESFGERVPYEYLEKLADLMAAAL